MAECSHLASRVDASAPAMAMRGWLADTAALADFIGPTPGAGELVSAGIDVDVSAPLAAGRLHLADMDPEARDTLQHVASVQAALAVRQAIHALVGPAWTLGIRPADLDPGTVVAVALALQCGQLACPEDAT